MRRAGAALALVLVAAVPWLAASAQEPDRLGLAVQLNDQGRRTEARRLLDTIVRQEPRNHRALWNRGLVAMEDEDFDGAIDWFDRALAVDDTVSDYHLWRGYAWARKLERSGWLQKLVIAPKIRSSFERAVELSPDDVKAHRALMRYYEQAPRLLGGGKAKARRQEEAIRQLERAGAPPS
jgi:tetratricopeptide (TPR) repeat protein